MRPEAQDSSPLPGTALPQGGGAAHVTQTSDVEPAGELGSRELASGVTRDRQEETPGDVAGADYYVVAFRDDVKRLEWRNSLRETRELAESEVATLMPRMEPEFACAYRVEQVRVVDRGEWKPFIGTGEPRKREES